MANSQEQAYLFRHALLRDVAYELHLPSDRAMLHGLVADILERTLAPADLRKIAFALADHCRDAATIDSAFGRRELDWLGIAAQSARRDGQPERALTACQRIVAHAQATPEVRLQARLDAARLKATLGHEVDAIADMAEVAAAAQALGSLSIQADALAGWAPLVLSRGEVEPSRLALRKCLQIDRDLGRRSQEAAALSELSAHAMHVGDPAKAEELSRQALKLYETTNDRAGMARAQIQLSYNVRQNKQIAEDLLASAQKLAQELDSKYLQREVWQAKGALAHSVSDWAKAEECRRHAYELALETGAHASAAGILDQLAGALRMQARYTEAEPLHLKALELLREIGDDRRIGVGLLNYAGLCKRMERLDEAAVAYEAMLAHLKKCGDVRILGHGQGNYAELLHKLNRLEESAAMFKEALDRLQQAGGKLVYLIQLSRYAPLLKRLGRDVEALAAYREAVTGLKAMDSLAEAETARQAMREVCADLSVPEPELP